MNQSFIIIAWKACRGIRLKLYVEFILVELILRIFHLSLYEILLNDTKADLITNIVFGPLFFAIFYQELSRQRNRKKSFLLSIFEVYRLYPQLYLFFFIYWILINLIQSLTLPSFYLVNSFQYPLNLIKICLVSYFTLFYSLASLSLFEDHGNDLFKIIKSTYIFLRNNSYFLFFNTLMLVASIILIVILCHFSWPLVETLSLPLQLNIQFDSYYLVCLFISLLGLLPFLFSLLFQLYLLKKHHILAGFIEPYLNHKEI